MIHYKGHNSLAEMISTHVPPFREALEFKAADPNDEQSYWWHESAALTDIEQAASIDLVAEVGRLDGMRALRLWHWQAVVRLRTYGDDADMRKSDSEHYNKRADWHLTQVQLLNDFFPIGDTAEHDNETNT